MFGSLNLVKKPGHTYGLQPKKPIQPISIFAADDDETPAVASADAARARTNAMLAKTQAQQV